MKTKKKSMKMKMNQTVYYCEGCHWETNDATYLDENSLGDPICPVCGTPLTCEEV